MNIIKARFLHKYFLCNEYIATSYDSPTMGRLGLSICLYESKLFLQK